MDARLIAIPCGVVAYGYALIAGPWYIQGATALAIGFGIILPLVRAWRSTRK